MYRIRLHGRGGQGMKTASRILGSAFFCEGFEVQDAPRYGAERRGAPMLSYVRASAEPIHERGAIVRPDLIVVADDTLVPIAAAGVLVGAQQRTVLLIRSREPASSWKQRLGFPGAIVRLLDSDEDSTPLPFIGASCAAGAGRLVGVISRGSLEAAVRQELGEMSPDLVAANLERALSVWDGIDPTLARVCEGPDAAARPGEHPGWIDLTFDDARISGPDIRGGVTSVEVRTGLWRTMRPVIDRNLCHHCHWVCGTLCPDSAIHVSDGENPEIDLEHCKGCMICVAVCPSHAISAVPEAEADAEGAGALPA